MARGGTHVTVPRVGASRARTLALPCSQTHGSHPAQSHISQPTHFPSSPYLLSILTLLAFHHSPYSLSIPLSFPHPPSPILVMFLSMACVLKRFPLTSPRKLSLTCVKWGFLRTAGPHWTPKLSPCSSLCRSAMFILCLVGMCHAPHLLPVATTPSPHCHAPAPGFPFLKFLTIISISPIVSSKSTFPSKKFVIFKNVKS